MPAICCSCGSCLADEPEAPAHVCFQPTPRPERVISSPDGLTSLVYPPGERGYLQIGLTVFPLDEVFQ